MNPLLKWIPRARCPYHENRQPLMKLDPETLLSAYAQGVFPMAGRDGVIRFYTAEPRGIIPLDERFHVPQTLRQLMRKDPPVFDVRVNHQFEATMRGCMESREDGTWISDELIAAYLRLHAMGFAHSVEAWQGGELVGGLYGVSLGSAFFGESMFHRRTDASKVALVHLVNRLRERKFELLDSQATTPHLRKFGAIDIPAGKYLGLLEKALNRQCDFA
ncbi:MAG: leucyl/phenylalanyl-tRNA--protein transferase [Phycisphaerales bacterium]|nr:leucyl/phenylalanyl-tRNA--protein transferase [Phycisphaerales bacterium]